MKVIFGLAALLLTIPQMTHAQGSVQALIENLIALLGDTILPALLTLAFVFLVFNIIRYFVTDSGNEDGRKNARALAIYGTLAFVLFIILWGTVNFLAASVGVEGEAQPCPDYIRERDPSACPPAYTPPPCQPGVITGPCVPVGT